jgi:FlaA1/EpsC-like NDP-sugar epimerase
MTTTRSFNGKRILITGGTGSLGKTLVRRLLTGRDGAPEKIVVFSRDEGKQHAMRTSYMKTDHATDEVIYNNFSRMIAFRVGDVRDRDSLVPALREADVVINAAALKQVPACEYFPYEAVRTNIEGAHNIVTSIRNYGIPIETVIGISTDKACKPVNVMGMSKALQERVLLRGSLHCSGTRFVAVRYGNVLASRGSVIPLFHHQISNGGPVTITDVGMTRFLLSLNDAVDVVFEAMRNAHAGETIIPIAPSAYMTNVASVLIGGRDIKTIITGIRPGEKLHEILISEEEAHRTFKRNKYYVIAPILPELSRSSQDFGTFISGEYSSGKDCLDLESTRNLLKRNKLLIEDRPAFDAAQEEILR